MKKKGQFTLAMLVPGILCLAAGLFILVHSVTSVHQEEISSYEGIFQRYERYTSKNHTYSMRLYVDDRAFNLYSVVFSAFDSAFLSDVQPGDRVYVTYWEKENAEEHVPRTLLGLRTDAVLYLTPADAQEAFSENTRLGIWFGAVLLGIGAVIVLVPLFRSKRFPRET